MEQDAPAPVPTTVDIRRLAKFKAEQEQRLKMLQARVDRLAAQERRVWKDVTWTQQMSLQAQEAQWRRQAQQAEKMRLERDLLAQEQALRERAREMRQRAFETKDRPRLAKFEENKTAGVRVREESRSLMMSLQDVREKTLQSKAMQVEVRRQQRRHHRLRKELEYTRREQTRQDLNNAKYAELQEEIQNAEAAIEAAEREEMASMDRLQNSQSVRAQVLSQLQEERMGVGEAGLPNSPRETAKLRAEGAFSGAPLRSPRGSHGNSRSAHSSPPATTRSRLSGSQSARAVLSTGGLGQITEERQEEERMDNVMDDGSQLSPHLTSRAPPSRIPRPSPRAGTRGVSAGGPGAASPSSSSSSLPVPLKAGTKAEILEAAKAMQEEGLHEAPAQAWTVS